MKKFLFSVAAVGLVLAMVLSSSGAAGDQPLIIDVRTEAEWNSGHLEGAVWIPYDVIGEKIGSVAKDKHERIRSIAGAAGGRRLRRKPFSSSAIGIS